MVLQRYPSSGKIRNSFVGRFRQIGSFTSYFSSYDDMEENPEKRLVELEFEVVYSEDEIAIIDQCIQILQEWKSELVEPNLTGDEPRISRNWERLPHESDNTSSNSAGTLGGA